MSDSLPELLRRLASSSSTAPGVDRCEHVARIAADVARRTRPAAPGPRLVPGELMPAELRIRARLQGEIEERRRRRERGELA